MARPTKGAFQPRLAEFRARAQLTQEDVAGRLGITPDMVRKHERGSNLPVKATRQRYCALYRASEVELGFKAGPNGTSEPPGVRVDETPALPVPQVGPSVLPSSVLLGGPERADATYLDAVRDSTQQLIALDNQIGGAELSRYSERVYGAVADVVGRGAYDVSIRTDLWAAAGELAEVAGWLAYDANRQEAVRRLNHEALYYTRLSGNREIELLTLQNASMHAGFLGRPFEALDLANSVLDGTDRLTSRVKALFLTRKARALAQGGDAGALALFPQIRSLYLDGVTDRDPAWTWWIDERELAWHQAMCEQDLGDHVAAVDHFAASVDATPASERRSQFLHRGYLLTAEVGMNAWSSVEASLETLRPLASEVASTRTIVLIERSIDTIRGSSARVPRRIVDQAEDLNEIVRAR